MKFGWGAEAGSTPMNADTYERCLGILKSIEQMSLRFRPKTDEPVTAFREAMELASQLRRSDLARLRAEAGEALSFKLMYLSTLAAECAMNTRDADWLRVALLGHVVEGFQLDWRENFLRLYAIEYAAYRAGLNLKAARRAVEPLMDDVARRHFSNVFSSAHGEAALKLANLGIETAPDGEVRFVART